MFDSTPTQVTNDLAEIEAALRVTFPDLDNVEVLRVLGTGFRSVVVVTAGEMVFRIAKNGAAGGYAKEIGLLPKLRARVPVAIPVPQWHARASESFPFGVMGYSRLHGRPLSPELLSHADTASLASTAAAFILALHQFSPEETEALGLPGPATREADLMRLKESVLPPLRDALTTREYRVVRRWWEIFLTDQTMWDYQPVVQHGDLWYENILVDHALHTVTGVLDFEQTAIGDPAQDFATQLHLGERFAAQVIDAYRAKGGVLDETFHHRMRKLWELREFDGIQFAVQYDDSKEFEDAVGKLRNGPILNGRA